jgi:type VI secretion system secreted protein VgrG
MDTYTQANRWLSVTTPLGKDVLLLVGIRGHEAVSELFHFHLDLLAKNDVAIAFDKIVGQAVTVKVSPLPGGPSRFFHGIVNRFSQGRRDETFTQYRAEIVPQLWLWTRKVQSRIFQHLTVPDILKQVLAGLNVAYQFKGAYHQRDYCVQYRESDFAFASRLMEEEGIAYYFTHADGSHQLIVTDDPLKHPDVPGPSPIIYEEVEGGNRPESRVTAWEKTQELRSGKYTLWDHCFELPGKNLQAEQSIQAKVAVGTMTHQLRIGGNEKLEIYQYPGGFAQRFDGVDKGGGDRPDDLVKLFEDNKRTACIRLEQEAMPSLEIRGAGNCVPFVPGHQFTLTRHFNADGDYLLTRVEHEAKLSGDYRSGQDLVLEYNNRFTCIPAALPYRPPLTTPKPTLAGTQTATVVGPKGEEMFVDKYGRVKVQFPWDRQGKMDGDSSCWVRVGQVWAGKRWGGFFWPRVGHEVVVAFEEGDPDRPVIVGNVYNAENMPPFKLPDSKLLAGIKSCSQTGKAHANYNGIVFHDEMGNEHVQVHSEKNNISTNESSKRTHIGATHQHVVGGIPMLGSGSGGGGGDDQPFATTPAFLGKSVDLTVGEKFEGTLGLKFEQRLGGKVEYYLSPNWWDENGIPADGADPLSGIPLLLGLSALLGKTEVKLSTEASILYGTKIEIHRGKDVQYSAEDWSMSEAPVQLASVAAAAQLAAVLIAGALEPDSQFWKDAEWFLAQLPWQICLVLLYDMESLKAFVQNAQKNADKAKDLSQNIMDVLKNPTLELTKYVEGLTKRVDKCAKDVADLAKGAPKAVKKR